MFALVGGNRNENQAATGVLAGQNCFCLVSVETTVDVELKVELQIYITYIMQVVLIWQKLSGYAG